MHGDDPPHSVEHPARDGVGGAAGQDLLGGLEEEAYGPRELALLVQPGQHEAGAEDDGGVHVVAAGVGAVGRGGAVRAVTLRVRDGQGVDVGAQREHGYGGVAGADVTDEAGADGEDARFETGGLQPCLDRGGGPELLVAQLGVHVQVAPERDEFGTQELRQGAREHIPDGLDLGLCLGLC